MESPDQQPVPPGPITEPLKARMTRGEVVEAPIQPLDVSGLRTVGVGTTGFLGATLYLLLFQLDWMRDTDRLWWLWTCFAGLGLGVFGFVYCTRRARHHQLHGGNPPGGPEEG